MTKPLDVFTNIDIDPWTDVPADIANGELIRIGLLPHGTVNGSPVVVMLSESEDGERFLTQVTWKMFYTAFKALALSPTIEMRNL